MYACDPACLYAGSLLFVDAPYWIDVTMILLLRVHTFGNLRFVVFRWVKISLYPASIGAAFYRIQGVNQNTGRFAFLCQVSRASLNHSEKLKCKSVGVLPSVGSFRRDAPPAITHIPKPLKPARAVEFLRTITQRLHFAPLHFVSVASLRPTRCFGCLPSAKPVLPGLLQARLRSFHYGQTDFAISI